MSRASPELHRCVRGPEPRAARNPTGWRSGPWLGALLALAMASPVEAQQVTGEEVKTAIRAGIGYLKRHQHADGTWDEYRMEGGTTALAVLALRSAGVPAHDPVVRAGAERLARLRDHWTYVVALKIQALAAVDPLRYRPQIQSSANWLIRAQTDYGLWGYEVSGTSPDHSNSQFALLGLHEAARAGVRIPETVWKRAELEWLQTQHRDGGWGYQTVGSPSTGSMTAAGVASLFITGNSLNVGQERGYTEAGAAPNCGKYVQNRSIVRGLDWLARQFDVRQNPGSGHYYYYYMYGLERVGILAGLKYIGRHDWYREGAAQLVARQRADGRWVEMHDVVDTSFALLFLGKGHRSLLFHKLQWSDDSRWNPDRHDLENLIAYIGDKLGEPVTWQVVGLDAPLEEWLAAPILYFQGHEFPAFSPQQVEKLVEYVRQGGAILAEACCSRPEFRQGFERFAAAAFPESPLRRLAPEHPIFSACHPIDDPPELLGIDIGCRTSVVLVPRDLSCLWEQANVPALSERAFRIGTNLAAYFTGRQKLPDRLDAVQIVRLEAQDEPIDPAALQIAQLIHDGDWRPDARAIPNLAGFLRAHADVDVVRQAIPLRPTDPSLRRHPIAYMTGHFDFSLTEDELQALREYLRRGGFLFADACCGREAFDRSFRRMAARLFPDNPLEPLPASHPILAGQPGFKLDGLEYQAAVTRTRPQLRGPVLEGITLEGRTVVVYSPYAVGCPLDGHACYDCRGLTPPWAQRLAANVILYALSY